ncbi:glycosyltransferase family 4 protein [uncultured Zobellia sp.]|uniref:glycosyltransferase family 4 protein n=1 Tax=uncultured Zobellia sp. TaxID=255433 RepID=UPI0025995F40|nr:glycosyltransferase family 4 protein [uncultured Zobellia sp.]
MKKILLSAYACSPYKGSEWSVGWSWAAGLAQKGFQVWCLTNVEDMADCEAEKQNLNYANLNFVPVPLSFGMDKRLLDNSSKTIYLHYYLWKRKASKVAQTLHEKHKFDIAQHVSYGSFQQGSPLYRLEDCKIIFGPVGGGQMALPIFKPYFGASWRTEVIRKYMSQFLMKYNTSLNETLKRADVILTVNQETEMLLKTSKYYTEGRDYPLSDSALPKQFLDMPYIKRAEAKHLRLLWIGRFLPRRGLELTFRALSYLPKDLPYELTIVGDGEQKKFIKGWMEAYDIPDSKIKLLGWVPYKEIHGIYEQADVMLFCPLRDTAGLQATEAMAFGLPVITMNISGMRTIVPPGCGIKINPTTTEGTAEDIAKAIEKMYQEPDFRKKASQEAYKTAMSYTWESKIEEMTRRFYKN